MRVGPLLLLLGPLLAALITGLLARWQRLTAVLGAIGLGLLWLLLWLAESEQQVSFIGRSLSLSASVRSLFLLLYGAAGLLFLLGIVFLPGRKFVPGILTTLALFAAALMIRPFLLGSVLLVSGMALTAVVVQDDRAGDIQAALRYLAQAILTLPFLLVAGWVLDSQSTGLAALFSTALLLGGLILLAAFPFHVWATTLINEASPLVWIFVFGIVPLVAVNFFYSFLTAQPAGTLNSQMTEFAFIAAAMTLLVALLLLATAVSARRFIAGLLLVDLASVVLTLGLSPAAGWVTAVAAQGSRLVSLFILSGGLLLCQRYGFGPLWRPNTEEERGRYPKGRGRLMPASFLFFSVGCLSLLGLPLTVGFHGRWAIVNQLLLLGEETAVARWVTLWLLFVIGAGVLVWLRGVQYWFFDPDQHERQAGTGQEPRWLQAVLLLTVLLTLLITFQAPFLVNFATQLLQNF